MEEKGKILIIDDNEDVLFALNLLLEPFIWNKYGSLRNLPGLPIS